MVFPEGTPSRSYCVRELAASTVFAALYIGAIEGSGSYFGPIHVYRMTNEQAARPTEVDRMAYARAVRRKGGHVAGVRWYADNTREPIRDETLREGLISVGAVVQRTDLPTTSGSPRYALNADFAALFNPGIQGEEVGQAIAAFQEKYLVKDAWDRIAIMRSGIAGKAEGVMVTFPGGENRQLEPGLSSHISKAVVEVFASTFLERPVILWLSESGNKVVLRDDRIASRIGLKIESDRNLPDLIIADIGSPETLLVFVEVVATDGAITRRRQDAIYEMTDAGGFKRSQVYFVTAFPDRDSVGFKKTVSRLAWGSLAWFMSEPKNLLVLHNGEAHVARLQDLIHA